MSSGSLKKIAVLGWGQFGTAMAQVATHNPICQAVLWERDEAIAKEINSKHINSKIFPNHKLNPTVTATTNLQEALNSASLVVGCLPTQVIPQILEQNQHILPLDAPFVSCSKGMIVSKQKFLSEVVEEQFNGRMKFCMLGGPSFASEMMDKNPTLVTIASKDEEAAKTAQKLLSSIYFKCFTQSDIIGVEVAGALKNVLAIGAGLIEGMGYGINTKSAYIARSCKEIQRFAEIYHAKPETFFGLAGIGDLMLTCFGNESRNRMFGYRIAKGESIDEILKTSKGVIEGLPTLTVAMDTINKYNIDAPIISEIYNLVYGKISGEQALRDLMLRKLHAE